VNESTLRSDARLATVPPAVIAFDFDPLLRIGDGAVRWETIGIAFAIFAGLIVAALAVRSAALRADDLLFIVLGIVPGAVVGGRLGYVLLHPAYFLEAPGRILDPGVGSLELTLAVVGGTLTGSLVALLLDGRPGPWLHAATLPTLLTLAVGKLATVLGGSGQGSPTTGEPATAYLGPGPWGSLGPEIPAIPSQALEAFATFLVLVLMVLLVAGRRAGNPDGRAFLFGLAGWCAGRGIVASTWRDPVVVGSLNAEQAICAVVGLGALLVVGLLAIPRRRAKGVAPSGDRGDGPSWPADPLDPARVDPARERPEAQVGARG
jgi:phosphatidylglycerol---prolipoprotein diacylglyceryl transferase